MPDRRYSPSEPVSELRRVPIGECGEELVDFLALCPNLILQRPRFKYRRETLLRRSVALMLCKANDLLPRGYRLAVIEGWRPPHIQGRLYQWSWNRFRERHPDWSDVQMKRTVNRYTAPMNHRVPPPHTTGGAVDLMLADEAGTVLDHTSPYKPFQTKGYHTETPALSPEAQKHREILGSVLREAGLSNYPSEYWHWSYGDQGWAYRDGHAKAIYGAVEPPGWTPAPEDAIEAPLVWIHDDEG
jgi:D-alanyl-D-alanine dipeptidase